MTNIYENKASTNPRVIVDMAFSHLDTVDQELSVCHEGSEVKVLKRNALLFIDFYKRAIERSEDVLDINLLLDPRADLYAIAAAYLGYAAGLQSRNLHEFAVAAVQQGVLVTDSEQGFWNGPIASFVLGHTTVTGAQDARFSARAIQEYFVQHNILPESFKAPEEEVR